MFLRLLILDNHKQIFENVNEEYINSINLKRNNFFSDYEIEPPNKEHSLQLMSQLKNKDITELKSIFRKYNSLNEILVSPFVLLLGEKPKKSHVNGQKKIIYFSIAQKLLNDRKINKKIKDINLETIPNNIFKDIEKIFQNDAFNFNKMKGYSPCLYNLICWEMGVIEYHRTVRNFCLNYYDMKILCQNLTSKTSSDGDEWLIIDCGNATGTLQAFLDGTLWQVVEIVNGLARINIAGLSNGDHNLTFIYSGDRKFGSALLSILLSVKHKVPRIDAGNFNIDYSSKKAYSVVVYKKDGSIASGVAVTFLINNKSYGNVLSNSNSSIILRSVVAVRFSIALTGFSTP